MKKRILLTGGGSGGHIYPLVAVAKKLRELTVDKKLDIELRYYGPSSIYDAYIKKEDIVTKSILNAKLRRYFSLLNFLDFPKLLVSFLQALFKVYWYMPDLAFSKGGPGALPVLFACWFYRIPIVIHESDTIPGLTNKTTSRWAKVIELGWIGATKYFSTNHGKIIHAVGVPIQTQILQKLNLDQQVAKEQFGFEAKKPLLLFIGGSLGAQRLNEFVLNNLETLLKKYQILHQTGTANFDEVVSGFNFLSRSFSKEMKSNYKAQAFFEKNIADAYAAADVIISRAGASAIFEIAAFGKPVVLVPLTESANDHQKLNAYEYAKTGAAVVIEENNFSEHVVITQIEKILADKEFKNKMTIAAKSFAKLDAAKLIAEDLLNLL